jgi:hypothetical protein
VEHEWLIGLAIQTVLFLGGGYGMVLKNDMSNRTLKEQFAGMQKELEKLANVIITQAVQTNRLDNLTEQYMMLNRTVEALRRGNGFIHGHGGVDGEYNP